MFRVMAFIDYQNFNINLKEHYKSNNLQPKTINYSELGKEINRKIPFNSEVIKTYLFAYRPCDKLLELESYKKYYSWLESLKNVPYLEIIEGRQEVRPHSGVNFDINNSATYSTEEKETDINLATHMLSKGFQNAYDIAILVSGDTDYIKVVETLHNIGKIVVIAHFQHQNISRYNSVCDAHVILYNDMLDNAANKKEKNK